jgi:hypothetical protein
MSIHTFIDTCGLPHVWGGMRVYLQSNFEQAESSIIPYVGAITVLGAHMATG